MIEEELQGTIKGKIKNKKRKNELLEIIEILVEFSSMYLIEQIKVVQILLRYLNLGQVY